MGRKARRTWYILGAAIPIREGVLTVSTQTTLTTLVVVSVTFVLAGALLLRNVKLTALEESHQQALLLTRTLAGSFSVPLAQGQHEIIQRQIDQIAELPKRYPDVVSLTVADEAGLIAAATDPVRFGDRWIGPIPQGEVLEDEFSQTPPRIVVRMPIQSVVHCGSLEVVLSVREPWKTAEEAQRGIIFALVAGMAMFMLTLTILLHRLVVRPVRELARAALAFSPGRRSLDIKIEGATEMRQLAGAFDDMAARLHEYTGGLEQKVEERTREVRDALEALQQANRQLQALAVTDGLTGVGNRRAFTERLALEVDRSKRSRRPLSLVMFDIDRFKQLNDTQGHQEGDRALVRLATLLAEGRRAPDLVARYGGEEFMLLLPDTSLADAVGLAERLRETVELRIPGLTVSAGVATYPESADDGTALVGAADRALYEAKATGRNKVCNSGPRVSPTPGGAA